MTGNTFFTVLRHILACLLLSAASCGWAEQADDIPDLVVMAAVSDDPGKYIHALRPLADYMSNKLAPLGVKNVEILIAQDLDQMGRFLHDGRVDWVTETAFAAATLEKQGSAEFLLRKWKHGVGSYQSVVFVRDDSDVKELADLEGRSIAFQHPGSTTGYFVPFSTIRAQALGTRALRSVRERPNPGVVNYIFSRAEYNSALWVHKNLVDAAVLSNLDWQRDDLVPAALRPDLRIIHTSQPIPRAVELIRTDLHPRVKQAIREVLLAAHEDPAAAEALRAYHMTLRFDELDDDALAALRQIQDALSEAQPMVEAP